MVDPHNPCQKHGTIGFYFQIPLGSCHHAVCGGGDWHGGDREFNRRIKQSFDRLGIEIPYPHQKLVMESSAKHPAQQDFPEPPPGAKQAG